MNTTINQLRQKLKKDGLDGCLISYDTDIRYLTGFPASESWLLVGPKRTYYITDGRYTLEAKEGLSAGVTVKEFKGAVTDTIVGLAQQQGLKILGVDGRHTTLNFYRRLERAAERKVQLKELAGGVDEIRIIKHKKEIDLIRDALWINIKAFDHIASQMMPGMTEQNVLELLTIFVKKHSAGFSFDPIVASGPNSCYPHARVTERKLKSNEPVLIDMGVECQGYKSDLTRMFFLGKISTRVQEVADIVKDAQLKAIAQIKPGAPVADADRAARKHFKKHKLEKYFCHSLGHGVGLDIHESPRLSLKSAEVFQPNMVVTVEPGIYLPGEFGVRIEDMVLVTERGCEVLSDYRD